jgi:hypothetical protein
MHHQLGKAFLVQGMGSFMQGAGMERLRRSLHCSLLIAVFLIAAAGFIVFNIGVHTSSFLPFPRFLPAHLQKSIASLPKVTPGDRPKCSSPRR